MTNTTAAAAVVKAATACACSEFEIGITTEVGGQPDFNGETTGCAETTNRVFAPGHDAKLKSLLIKAGVRSLEVKQGNVSGDAITMARQFGFAEMVKAGIERGTAKKQLADEKAAAKAARPAKAPKADKAAKGAARAAKLMETLAAKNTAPADAEVPADAIIETPAASGIAIKVGRWEYKNVTIVDGDAHYTDAAGNARTAVEGNYKIV